ncbi:MAG TPA: S1 RNA-binding domain-containing protein, partial [Solirubrobacteraceae bacterium]
AAHHVENPREIVNPGDEIRVKVLEIDSERRRLSLSAKRVEGQILPLAGEGEPAPAPLPADDGEEAPEAPEGQAGSLDDVPELGLSEDVFAEAPPEPEVEAEPEAEAQAPAEAEAPADPDTAESPSE